MCLWAVGLSHQLPELQKPQSTGSTKNTQPGSFSQTARWLLLSHTTVLTHYTQAEWYCSSHTTREAEVHDDSSLWLLCWLQPYHQLHTYHNFPILDDYGKDSVKHQVKVGFYTAAFTWILQPNSMSCVNRVKSKQLCTIWSPGTFQAELDHKARSLYIQESSDGTTAFPVSPCHVFLFLWPLIH